MCRHHCRPQHHHHLDRHSRRLGPRVALAVATCTAAAALAACDAGDSADGAVAGDSPAAATTSTSPSRPPETASSTVPDPVPTVSRTPSPTGRPSDTASGVPSPAPSSPASPVTSASPRRPRLLVYAGGESPGVMVRSWADARHLDGAPAAFRRFVVRTAQRVEERSHCSSEETGVTVQTLRTDGYAAGSVDECGGYRALWAVVDGRWRQIEGTQEAWDCRGLRHFRVPSDVAGTSCYDYAAQQERRYHQA